jgi:transposase
MVDDIFDNSRRPLGRVEVRTGVGRRRRWTEEQKGRIVAESYRAGAVVSEVARRYEISPQHLFAWRKAARAGLLVLPNEEELTFVPIVTPGDNSTTVGNPQESRLIRIEIAGAVVHAGAGVDLVFLTDVLRAVKAAA